MYKVRHQPTKFPEGMAICAEKWMSETMKKHRKTIKRIKAVVPNKAPKGFPKRQKENHMKKVKLQKISQENSQLLNRLLTVRKDDAHLGAYHRGKGLNKEYRRRKLEQIQQANGRMRIRLKAVQDKRGIYDRQILKPKQIKMPRNHSLFIKQRSPRTRGVMGELLELSPKASLPATSLAGTTLMEN
jgi:hypothetical protein